MIFTSPLFVFCFLPVVLGIYFIIRRDLRNVFLTLASLGFYVWGEGLYATVLLACILLNYLVGLLLSRCPSQRSARCALAFGVLANLGMLLTFKYANFLVNNLNLATAHWGWGPVYLAPLHLPLGISFFTFQALSYLIDVYRGDVCSQRSLINFSLYKSLFPQLIAGPIVRYRDVAGEIGVRSTGLDDVGHGARRFILGLAKKVLIANTLAVVADGVFGAPSSELTPALAWLGIICYGLQIYFDFSGYSDMAIGLGRMFGFHFLENFDYPYSAQSMTEFWRRWHISLSSWFRDYVYIPLGGNRGGRWRTYFNLGVVFFLCGLWHGASWNFVIWGLFHGFFLVVERMGLGSLLDRGVGRFGRHIYVVVTVSCAWVFFRADSLSHALAYLEAMSGRAHGTGITYYPELYLTRQLEIVLAIAIIGSTPLWKWLIQRGEQVLLDPERPTLWRVLLHGLSESMGVALHLVLLGISVLPLAAGTHNPFIYFRF